MGSFGAVFNKLCKSVFTPPQIEADLKMQTNMHLRSPGGGTCLCSFPGTVADLSRVIHESA